MLQCSSSAGSRRNIPFNPESAALLILDVQDFFLKSESHAFVPSAFSIIDNVNTLASAFRERGRPVIFTKHIVREGREGVAKFWWGDLLDENHPHVGFSSDMNIDEKDLILEKDRYSAFCATDLEEILHKMGVEQLIIAGVTTHLCVESTARDGFMRDLLNWVVVDATADWNEDYHVNSLKATSHGFSSLVKTGGVLDWMKM